MKSHIPTGTVMTIELEDCDIDFDFSQAEKQTKDYPGCDAALKITTISIAGHEIPLTCFKRRLIGYLEDKILKDLLEDQRNYEKALESVKIDRAIDESKERLMWPEDMD
jgi:hypothetical protein